MNRPNQTTEARLRRSKMKNTLVQYKGGGYDGCFWEWNYAFFDHNGEFHSIFASGRNGCETLEKFNRRSTRGDYQYRLDRPDDCEQFVHETNASHVVMVAAWLAEHIPDMFRAIQVNCEVCCEQFEASRAHHSGFHGNGGIGVVMTGYVCPSCQDDDTIRPGSIRPMIVIMRKLSPGAA